MQRRIAVAVVGGVLLVALGGFFVVRAVTARSAPQFTAAKLKPTTCADAYQLLKLRPSQIEAANPVCLTQSLQLSGEVVGTVGQAYPVQANDVGPTSMCAVPKRSEKLPTALLAVVAGGKGYRLRISTPGLSQHQALAIGNASGMVELTSIAKPSIAWNQASGTVNVSADGITGTIDVNVLRDVSGARPVHITGKWACGVPLPLPAFDASAPCANFYALNHLHDDDIARMKASGCNAEDLTFSGALAAHVDHAVTDSVAAGYIGLGIDNTCGTRARNEYYATFKFSVGDETFLFNLHAVSERYSEAVQPGVYPARAGGSWGMALILGHADPARRAVFVEDGHVSWLSSDGSFTIAADMKSGTVDAELKDSLSGSSVHVKGSWRCAA